jgi:hypothetical protein
MGGWAASVLRRDGPPAHLERQCRHMVRSDDQTHAAPLLEALEPRLLLSGSPVISEFMAINDTSLVDGDSQHSDWIEIHNPGDEAVDLTGWTLKDSVDTWAFPSMSLGVGQYIVLFASNGRETVAAPVDPFLDPAGYMHTNFKLRGSGEYLGLFDETDTVVHEYDEYPEQNADISYGLAQTVDTTGFVLEGDATKYTIPDSDPGVWTDIGFDDSSWSDGATGIGFSDTVAGFALTNYRANVSIGNLATALQVIATPGMRSWSHAETVPFVDFMNSGGGGHFTADQTDYPGFLGGDQNNFVIEATGFIDIPTAGPWTFGVNSDDGFSLELDNGTDNFYMEFPNGRGAADSISTFNVTEAGVYNIRLVQFEGGGGAAGELFAGSGAFGGFDASFRLVGDTANGGLAVMSLPIGGGGGSTGGFPELIETDIKDEMKGTNASMFARIPFTLTADDLLPGAISSLTFRMKYDDGYVAYLNGVKVAQQNVPINPLWDSTATLERSDAQALIWENVNLTDYIGQLQVGPNVLAIHGLNYATGDGDFLILPELVEIVSAGLGEHFLAIGTPGEANTSEYWLYVEDTNFSHDRGFYDEPFDLEITSDTPGAEIHYTTDGSRPSESHGTLYTAPITISTTTAVRAIAFKTAHAPTDIDTQSYFFLDDVLVQPNDPAGFPSDWRGTAADYEMDPDIVDNPIYADRMIESLQSLPTMSIVTDVDDLFDASSGIYSNSGGSGLAWERATSVELIHPDGTKGFQVNAAIRMQGGAFRGMGLTRKHSFRLLFKGDYGPTKLDYELFEEPGAVEKFDTITLRAGANDSYGGWGSNSLYIRDEFVRETQLALGDPSSHGTFVHLYVNGLYWGLYNPLERPDAAFASSYYGGEKEEWDALNSGEAIDGTRTSYNEMLAQSAAGLATNEAYQKFLGNNPDRTNNPAYETQIDLKQYANYMMTYTWLGIGDWPSHNWYAGRDIGIDSTGYKGFVWDAEYTLGAGGTGNNLGVSTNITAPWAALKQNAEFRMFFADAAHKGLFNGGAITPEVALERFGRLADEVELGMIAESARWGDMKSATPHDLDDWYGRRDYILNDYLVNRSGIYLNQLRAADLYPDTDAPSFNINASYQHGGTINLGDLLTIDAAPGVAIYYTTDGSDPREYGGGAPDAGDIYSGAIALNEVTQVKARAYDSGSGEWSALNEAVYYVDLAPDIRITEIMYNPAPATQTEIDAGFADADDFEYIEIKNISAGETLPLGGLRLTDGVQYTFGGVSIAPGEYVIVANNPAAFQHRYSGFSGTVVGGFVDTTLSNGGEQIRLDSPIGGIIHDFEYKDGWYDHTDGEGFSLTIRDPQGASDLWDQKIGWRPSAAIGGTPGYDDVLVDPGSIIINEVLAHSDAPYSDTIELYNVSAIDVDISGWFLSDSSLDLTSYEIPSMAPIPSGGYAVFYADTDFGGGFLLSEHGDDVYLSSNASGAAGGYRRHVDFGASPRNVSFGLHTKTDGGTDFTLLEALSFGSPNAYPYSEGLVINEVLYHPFDPTQAEIDAGFINENDFEFVEIYNTSASETYDLDDYYFSGGIGFSPGWIASNADPSGHESRTREPGATATWTATLPAGPDTYEVLVRWDMFDGLGDERNLDGRAAYVITHDGGVTAPLVVDQFEPDPASPFYMDPSGWVSLGSYTFDGSGQVVMARGTRNPDNWTVAAELKFVSASHSEEVSDPLLDSWYESNGSTTIAPGEYKVIVRNRDAFDLRYSAPAGVVLGEYTGALSNNGDEIRLMHSGSPEAAGLGYFIPFYRIDRADYNDIAPWPIEGDGAGYSIVRLRPGPGELYGNDPASWSAGAHFGTPGLVNSLIDPTPPTSPTQLASLVALTPDVQIDLTWSAASDPDSHVDHYVIYRDGAVIGTSATTSFSDTGALLLTQYCYQVSAVNRDQFEGVLSSAVDITIPGPELVEIPNDTTVRLIFTEDLSQAEAEDTANYAFSGGAISSAVLTGPNAVELTIPTLVLNQAYTVTAGSIATVSGLLMPASQQLDFEYRLAEGSILREYWTGIGGSSVTDLTNNANYPDNPSRRGYPTVFEAPTNWADDYGTRMGGYFHPTVSGMYSFSIASNDYSELYLSTDADPANAVKIANVSGSTGWRNWTAQSSQQSDPVYLSAGQAYYIEAIQKERNGDDHLSVAFKLDAGAWTGPIDGAYLSPYRITTADNTPPAATTGVLAAPISSTKIDISWDAASDAESGVGYYVIYRDGLEVGTSATLSFTDISRDQTQSYVYSVSAVNGDKFEGPAGLAAAVTPLASISLVSAASDTELLVTFGKPVTQATAEIVGNYTVEEFGGIPVSIVAAVWASGNPDQVTLTLGESLGANVIYSVSAAGVEDALGQPIEPGAEMQFTYGGLDADLLAWWTFDVDSGQTSHDLTDNNRDMTVSGAQWTASGRRGGAYQFNGSSNDFLFDDDAENYINGLGAFTFAAWIKADQLGGDMGVYSLRWPNTNDEYGFRHDAQLPQQSNQPNGYRTGIRATGGTQHWESAPNAESTEWVHVAMTWASGQSIEVYFNGFLQTPGWVGATVTGTIRDTDRLLLGRGPRDSGGSWIGMMDDVRIYGDALSQTEVMSIVDPRPLAVNDGYEAIINRTLTVTGSGVLLNDFDPDPGPAPITADLVSDVDHGTLALNADGSFVYTPTPGYQGPDSFTYRAYDGEEYGMPATVSLSVVQAVRLLSSDVVDSTNVELLFSTALDQTVAETVGNYILDGGLTVTSAALGGDLRTMQLVLSDAMTDGQTYTMSISNIEDLLGDTIAPGTQIQLVYSPIGDGFVLWEYWNGIGGGLNGLLNSPNYPDSPTDSDLLTIFEAPTNWNDGYGSRMRGYIFPPDTGNYTFWIASDDASQLLLSTNDNPSNAVKIAEVIGWTPARQWFRNASQKSVEIPLVAGQKYYIEAIHIEGGGGDNLSVAWEMPGAVFEGPIPGLRLSPFVSSNDITPPSTPGSPTATAVSSSQIDLSWTASFDGQTGIDHYVIYRDGAVLGVTTDEVTLQFSDTTAQQAQTYIYSVAAINGDGLQSASAAADPISPPPSLVSVVATSDTQVVATFGEPVMQAGAQTIGNYDISFGGGGSIAISAVQWDAGSPETVLLTLGGPLTEGASHTLTVQNIIDAGGSPVATGESMNFTYSDAWTFDAGTDGFVYADDAFGTNNPSLAVGSHEPAAGFNSSGALRVYLGPGPATGAMSGGWSRSFVAPAATTAEVSLRYRLIMAPGYEPDEYSQVVLEIDGVRYGPAAGTSVAHITGDDPNDTGWLQASFEIPVTAGVHTITIGAYNNKSTAGDEVTELFIDDVVVAVVSETPPTADIIDVDPDLRTGPIDEVQIVFSEPVSGFEIGDLDLVLDGGANLLSGAQTLTTGDDITWTLAGLTAITAANGTYELTLSASGSGILNSALIELATDAADTWRVDSQAPTVDIIDVNPDPRKAAVSSIDIVFDEPVTGLEVGDLVLTRDGGANLLTGAETLTTTDYITWTLSGLSGLTGHGDPGGGFVAFNDQVQGGGTHANATIYDAQTTVSGELKDIITGLSTGVTLALSQGGVNFSPTTGVPAAGTDAYGLFNGYVDFSSGAGASLEIEASQGDFYIHTFSGLDSGEARYSFHGTAIRGDAAYTDRWTVVTIVGADSFVADYSSGIGVVTSGLAASQVAIWSGHNSAADQGFVAGWTDIDPGADGKIIIVSQQYTGPTPGVGSGTANGSKGYAIAGIRLEKLGPGGTEGLYELQLAAGGSGVQDAAGNALGGDASDTWVIDTSGPIADIIDVSPDPHNGAVDEIEIVFDEPVSGFDAGDLDLTRDGGANLLSGAQTLSTSDNITWTLGNLAALTGQPGEYTLALTASGSEIKDALDQPIGDDAVEQWTVSLGPASIVARHVFYNNSAGDNNGPLADADDDAAIDASKYALLPGHAATLANYTSYTAGLNGIMIDIENLAVDPVAGDFVFMIGNDFDRSVWTAAPAPASITVRPGAGAGGSDRVTIIWADGAIVDKWLEVTVRSDAGIGLGADDLFYFGNLVGESDGDRIVDVDDSEAFFDEFGMQGPGLAFDFNKDLQVALDDLVIMQESYGSALADPPVLAGDVDLSGTVDDGDYDILVSQFGMTGAGLLGDVDGDGHVSLADFSFIRMHFGDTLPPVPAPAPAAAMIEPIAQLTVDQEPQFKVAAAPIADSGVGPALAPSMEMLAAGQPAEGAAPEAQPVSFGLSETTALYSTQIGDDEPGDDQDDLLADILAESQLAMRI